MYLYCFRTTEKSVANGANNGYQLFLDAESYDYASASSVSEGFIVSILHQLDIPIMKQIGIQASCNPSKKV